MQVVKTHVLTCYNNFFDNNRKMQPSLLITMIMVGCCANVITFELMLNEHTRAGSIVTIAQFIFISMEGLVQNVQVNKTKQGSIESIKLKQRATPLYFHALLVGLFFSQTVVNNLAFSYNISLPLHSIFRSGSLIMNMLVGMIGFGERYVLSTMLLTFVKISSRKNNLSFINNIWYHIGNLFFIYGHWQSVQ
jgi:hypothetical protein